MQSVVPRLVVALALVTMGSACSGTGATEPSGSGITPEFGILAVGSRQACVIEATGTTVCWGLRTHAGVGVPAVGSVLRTPVSGAPEFALIATNGSYTCGKTIADADLCWGRLPQSGTSFALTPTALTHGPYLQVSPGRLVACGLNQSHLAFCWGFNQAGEVGDGTQTPRPLPVSVPSSFPFESIEAAWLHTCALTFQGKAFCWGRWHGQLWPSQDLSPIPVPGDHLFRRLFVGGTHTCGIATTEDTWCWGDNGSGQLGSGVASGFNEVGPDGPVKVTGGHGFVMIAPGTTAGAAGLGFTCGLTNTGQVLCWGLNDEGQLGDGTTVDHLAPAPIRSSETFVAVDAGDRFACAMTRDRRVFCWGSNTSGEQGRAPLGGFFAYPREVP